MRRARTAFGAAVLAALGGCASCDTVPKAALEACEASQVTPGLARTDILFVIDDSGSMSQEQANVSANLPLFVQALRDTPQLDFQVGVTTTSVENWDRSSFAPAGDLVGPILPGASATLVTDFQAQVLVGTSGSGKEQPFRAARLALEKSAPGGANEGFVRPGSRIIVVFVSDEDDCSDEAGVVPLNQTAGNPYCHEQKATLDRVASFVAFLRGPIAGEAHDVRVAAVVGLQKGGPWAPSCGDASNASCDSPATALTCTTALDRGDRYVELLDAMGASTTVRASVCDASFAETLEAIAGLAVADTMPLDGEPADWRMLAVTVTRPTGTVACEVAEDAPVIPATADAIYTPPQAGRAPTLKFQGDCALGQGDRVKVSVVCAG